MIQCGFKCNHFIVSVHYENDASVCTPCLPPKGVYALVCLFMHTWDCFCIPTANDHLNHQHTLSTVQVQRLSGSRVARS
jgi:hypothetical protein